MERESTRAVGDRIEALVLELSLLEDPRARERSEEVIRLLMDLYGAGLKRVIEISDEAGEAGKTLLGLFADDPLVASLLMLHGLHPIDVETRVGNALERVRPYLGSHGGDVSLASVTDGVVLLRLKGSCDGCPSSAVTMKLAIERAIMEAAPEVVRIDVEGLVPPPVSTLPTLGAAQVGQPNAQPKAQSKNVQESKSNGQAAWTLLPEPMPVFAGGLASVTLEGTKLLVCRVGEALYAYRDSCPACGAALAGGSLSEEVLACFDCGRRFDVRGAGRSLVAEDLHLEPFPLLLETGSVKIALPALAS